MSQAAVERTLGKLITDECFRVQFFRDPAAATFHAGLELSRVELEALSKLPKKWLAGCDDWLDDRICRLTPDGEDQPTSDGMSVSRRGMHGGQYGS